MKGKKQEIKRENVENIKASKKIMPSNNLMRIHKKDYDFIPKDSKFITHFNLQRGGHKVGEIYCLPKIIKSGYYKNDGDEVLPILDFENCFFGRCIEVREFLDYEDLTEKDFKYSFENIKNVKELKKEILFRYTKSMPNLPKEEIFNAGIGLSTIEVLGKIKDNEMVYFDKKKSYYSSLDLSQKEATRVGFGAGILEAVKKNANVIALTADLKPSLKLDKFEERFPKNFYEVGISEQNMMSMAAGMCLNDKIPFVTSFAAFNPGRNWDQLRVSVCYSNHNVKVIGSHAGLTTGEDGATHQALEDIAITRVLPNMTVIVPADFEQAKQATIAAAEFKGPVYIRVSREKTLKIFNEKDKFEIGKAQVLDRGDDVTIIACGVALEFALEAKEKLLSEGIDATVINLHTIKPLDEKTILKYAKKTGCFVTIEEHQKAGGMGSAISEFISENYPIPIEIIGTNDTFGESGKGVELLEKYGISTKEIIKRVKKVVKRKN